MTLPDYITAHLSRPFKWGENDCMHFATGWVENVTGRDILAPYRPWANARQARRKNDQVGGLVAFFDAHFERIEPNMAGDGDLTVIRDSASLFSGAHVVSVGIDGLIFTDRTEALCAWRF